MKPKPISIQHGETIDTVTLEAIKKATELKFSFDSVLNNVDQELAFEDIALPTCEYALKGYNGTIFAYGQTGSLLLYLYILDVHIYCYICV